MNIAIYMCKEEYEAFHEGFKNSLYRRRNDYARKLLLGKPVVMIYRNRSLDDFIDMGSGLRKELRRYLSTGTSSAQEKEELNKKIISIEENLIKLVELCKQESEETKTS